MCHSFHCHRALAKSHKHLSTLHFPCNYEIFLDFSWQNKGKRYWMISGHERKCRHLSISFGRIQSEECKAELNTTTIIENFWNLLNNSSLLICNDSAHLIAKLLYSTEALLFWKYRLLCLMLSVHFLTKLWIMLRVSRDFVE